MHDPARPCDEVQLAEAETALGVPLPTAIRQLYSTGDGRHRKDGEWWVVWPLRRVVSSNVQAWEEGSLPRSHIAIGDDGTGNPFCVSLDRRSEVVLWSWIASAVERSEGALTDFLEEWVVERR